MEKDCWGKREREEGKRKESEREIWSEKIEKKGQWRKNKVCKRREETIY